MFINLMNNRKPAVTIKKLTISTKNKNKSNTGYVKPEIVSSIPKVTYKTKKPKKIAIKYDPNKDEVTYAFTEPELVLKNYVKFSLKKTLKEMNKYLPCKESMKKKLKNEKFTKDEIKKICN